MKIILIIILIFLTGCSSDNKPIAKMQKTNPLNDRFSRKIEIIEKEVVIGEATTNILDQGKNRVNNIRTACEKISGTEVKEGEIFSFNSATGKRSAENGYKNAPVIVNGEKSYGIGGGVCQVSTTIYLAALNSDIDIVEHHTHSESVAYAPRGKDATVVYGVKDLKIKNNTHNPIYIYTWIENEKVFVKIIKKSIDIQYN